MLSAAEEFQYADRARLWEDFHGSWSMPAWIFIPGERMEYQNKMLGVYR